MNNASLRFKLTVLFSLIVVAIYLALALAFYSQIRNALWDSFTKQGILLAENLAYNSKYGVFAEDHAALNDLIDGVLQVEDVVYVVIARADGSAIVRRARAGTAIHEPDASSSVIDGSRVGVAHVAPGAAADGTSAHEFRARVVSAPLPGPNRDFPAELLEERALGRGETTPAITRGIVRIGMSPQRFGRQLHAMLRLAALVTAGMMAGGVAVIYMFSSRVTRPLESLTTMAQRVADGDFSQHAPVHGRDEVGRLSEHFNRMIQSLEFRDRRIRESEERFREMAENINEVFWMTPPDKSRMIYVSPAYETIWGRTRQSLYDQPRSWMEAIHEEDLDRVARAAVEKQAVGTYDEQYRIVRPDGGIRWIRDRAFPVRDERGHIVRVAGVAADITDQKLVADALQRANRELAELNANLEERVRARTLDLESVLRQVVQERGKTERILDEIADGVVVVNEADDIVLVNPAARNLLFGTRWHEGDLPFMKAAHVPQLREVFHGTDDVVSHELVFFDTQRSATRVVRTTASPLTDDQGRLLGKVAVFHDVTSFKEIDRLKSEFVSHVSHELRTPLTSITGYLDNLRDGIAGTVTAKQMEYLDRMSDNVERLVRLINDLLDISRIEAGKMTIRRQPLTLADVVASVLNSLRPLAAEKGLTLVVTPCDDSRMEGDRDKLEQVVTNLADNAIKFAPHGSEITVTIRKGGGLLTLSIRDVGPGIPPEERARIFEPFYRSRSESVEHTQGTGLGLFITKKIVEMHGGRIWVNSEPGRGSEFSVAFPVEA